jgi:hypothetical protein
MNSRTILSITLFVLTLSALAQDKSKKNGMQRIEINYDQSREYVLGNIIDLDLIAWHGNDKTGITKRKSEKRPSAAPSSLAPDGAHQKTLLVCAVILVY